MNIKYLIISTFEKKWWEISTIEPMDMIWLLSINEEDENYRPIPLTEEWLVKFGFEQVNQIGAVKRLRKNELFQIRIIDTEFFYNHRKIEFIHQLQNLYFALTGEELTIKN